MSVYSTGMIYGSEVEQHLSSLASVLEKNDNNNKELLSAIKLYIQKCRFPANGSNDLLHNTLLHPPINVVLHL